MRNHLSITNKFKTMNFNFDFLKNVTLTVPETSAKTTSKVDKNPTGMKLRVYASGRVYPSQELVDALNLEYCSKESDSVNNGLDVFKSIDWGMFPQIPGQDFIFVCAVPKSSAKVDMFGQVGYDENGTPKVSVMEQGGGTFGKELVDMIESVYGITIEKGQFIDLEFKTDVVIKSPNDVYFIPKTVARGEKKGEITVIRREYVNVMPLIPVVEPETVQDPQLEIDFPGEELTDEEAFPFTDMVPECEGCENTDLSEEVPVA